MTTSDILKSAWKALEEEQQHLPGVYERRVFAHSGFTLFAGLVRPGLTLRFTMGVPSTVSTDRLERETTGFKVQRHYNAAQRSTYVSLELGRAAFRELFEVMAEDVAATVLVAPDEAAAVEAMRERLNRWERFMRAVGPEGMSREDQIGLFGELTFLRRLLSAGVPAEEAVTCWKGPSRDNQDFQIGDRAVEVKATTGNSATSVRISNELQLDDTDCERLYLLHLWLKEIDGGGTTLPQLVDEVGSSLTGAAAQAFSDRLVDAGYHAMHRALYEETGYSERDRRYYLVEGEFPRIRRADLRPGVSKIKYGIELAGFDGFVCDEASVIARFTGTAE